MEDAEGPSDPRALLDAEGPEDARKLADYRALIPPGSELSGEFSATNSSTDAEVVDEATAAKLAEQSKYVESLLNTKAPEEATPWALSVHLEERIQKLQNEKTKVNVQLDNLEASSKQLEKRLSSL